MSSTFEPVVEMGGRHRFLRFNWNVSRDFRIFFLVNKKIKIQSFSLLHWNYLLILKIHPETRFKDLKAAILTLKMLLEAACNSVTSSRKPSVTIFFSCAFSLQPIRGRHSAPTTIYLLGIDQKINLYLCREVIWYISLLSTVHLQHWVFLPNTEIRQC